MNCCVGSALSAATRSWAVSALESRPSLFSSSGYGGHTAARFAACETSQNYASKTKGFVAGAYHEVIGSALEYELMEETTSGLEKTSEEEGACTLAERRYIVDVATERRDVGLDPFEYCDQVV